MKIKCFHLLLRKFVENYRWRVSSGFSSVFFPNYFRRWGKPLNTCSAGFVSLYESLDSNPKFILLTDFTRPNLSPEWFFIYSSDFIFRSGVVGVGDFEWGYFLLCSGIRLTTFVSGIYDFLMACGLQPIWLIYVCFIINLKSI